MAMPVPLQIQYQQAAAADARRAADLAAARAQEQSDYARAVTIAGGTRVHYSEHRYEVGEISAGGRGSPIPTFILNGDFSTALGLVGIVRCGSIKRSDHGSTVPLLAWRFSTGLTDPKDSIPIGPAALDTARYQNADSVFGVRLSGPFGMHLALRLWIAENTQYYKRLAGACRGVVVSLGVQWAGEPPEIPAVGEAVLLEL